MRDFIRRVSFFVTFLLFAALNATSAAEIPARVSFNEHVRPILSNHCWSCHGPDEAARAAKLRLDLRDSALGKGESGKVAIVPGKLSDSELIARIEAHDVDVVMPPPSAKKPINDVQRAILKRWVEQGAEYARHWAFESPRRVELPAVKRGQWVKTPIDAFVLARLEQAGLEPSTEASPNVWLRRVTLDLTGLPPTLEELDAFTADLKRPTGGAHERVVERLLKSPRHAERMAMQWLDAARYADTNGYNNDEMRTMWPWRDWVINAFARGMTYDQFLTEQLAGDLLPNVTLSQKVATGFNRNHVLTTEGGIFEEEYHCEYVADRIHTTATVFLALSLQCARCHDHKYDPLTQREYYEFAAFFNNVPDRIVGYSQGRMAEPLLKVPSPEQEAELTRLDTRRGELEMLLKQRAVGIDADVAKWERSLTPEEIAKSGPAGLAAHFMLDESEGERVLDVVDATRHGTIKGKVNRAVGKLGGALEFDGQTFVEVGQVGTFDSDEPFSFAVWVRPTSNDPTTVLSKIDEANAFRGYDLILEGAKVASHFVHVWPGKAFKVVTNEPLKLNEWQHLVVTYDGSRRATGVKIFVDGKDRSFDVTTNNELSGTLKTDKPFHIGQRQTSASFKGSIDEVQLYTVALTADDAARLASGESLARLKDVLAIVPVQRNEAQRQMLRQYFLERVDPESKTLRGELAELPKQREAVEKAIPVTMVMIDAEPRRKTFVLKRGQYDQHGDEVTTGVPASLGTLPPDVPRNRLGLARWLTNPAHPLTSRVAVNRWWEMFFGMGLVETAEDFGVQGALPSHPELLDWLATELIRTGWDQRAMLRQIVLSATYRQSSSSPVAPRQESRTRDNALLPDTRLSPVGTPVAERQGYEIDPRNRLLWRGPRYRLPAETIRDHALFVSGLMKEKLGGPSVKPYQPEGLWEDVSVERREKYVPDVGDGLYRRSMYTFWKRTSPPPSMTSFDAPDRETCVIRRSRTNTPLQALVLLNDPTYIEAARKLAERVLVAEKTDDARLALVFKLVVTRDPDDAERRVLTSFLDEARRNFQTNSAAATQLLSIGHTKSDSTLDPATLAAWTTLTSLLLNLDEAITKT